MTVIFLASYRGAWGSCCLDTVEASHPFEAACTFYRNHPWRRLWGLRAIVEVSR